MTLEEAIKRIEELEARVRVLEARPAPFNPNPPWYIPPPTFTPGLPPVWDDVTCLSKYGLAGNQS